MGHYYLHSPACQHCRRVDPNPRHIGKGIPGWCFMLHVYPAEDICDLDDWLPILYVPGSVITNEFDERLSPENMLTIIRERAWTNNSSLLTDEYLRHHRAEIGPNNLLRHKLGRGCVKHGEGTWDCFACDFQ